MIDRLDRLPLTRPNLELVAHPLHLHRHVMAMLPDLHGRSTAIRADTQTQFRVDLPSDRFGHPSAISLRVRGPVLPTHLPELSTCDHIGDGALVTAHVACQRRKTLPDGRVRTLPVSDEHAPTWMQDLLARHGMQADHLAVSRARRFGSAGQIHFTVRDLTARVTVTDAALAHMALHHGIGRGRAYGLGMLIQLTPNHLETVTS